MDEHSQSTRASPQSCSRRLDTLRDQFEHAWRSGAGVGAEAFLDTPDGASHEDQAALLRELVALEWE